MLSPFRNALPGLLAIPLSLVLAACGGASSPTSSGTPTPPTTTPNTPAIDTDAAPKSRSATLTWQAPLTRANGESLSMGEIEKYVVRYGPEQSIGERSYETTVEDGQAMEHTVAGLSKGTWHFALKAVDTNGLESEWSESVSKIIAR